MRALAGILAICAITAASALWATDTAALKERKAQLEQELAEINAALAAAGEPVAPPPAATSPEPAFARGSDGLVYAAQAELAAGMTFAACAGCGDKLDDREYPEIAGAGRLSLPLTDTVALQLDAEGWNTFTGRGEFPTDPGEDNLQTMFSGAAHLAWRDPTVGAAGGFGQVGSVNAGEDANAIFVAFGLEGQYYFEDVTLYGQTGLFYADDEAELDVTSEGAFARGVVRWYPMSQLRLQAEGAYFIGEERPDGFSLDDADVDGTAFGARVDYQPSGRPFSLFAAYDGVYVAADRDSTFSLGDLDYKDHRVMLGVSLAFGGTDMKDSDRRGVAFDTPDIGRWIAPSLEILDD